MLSVGCKGEMTKRTLVDVIVPFYQSASFINLFLTRFRELCENQEEFEFILVAIDDGSTDQTWDCLKVFFAGNSNLKARLLKLSRNFGQHPATFAGLKESHSDIIVIMDGDLENDPLDIPLLLSPIKSGRQDIAIATYKNKRSQRYRLISRFIHKRSFDQVTSTPSTFKAFNSHIREVVSQYSEFSRLSGPTIESLGFRQISIPISRESRRNFGTRYSLSAKFHLGFLYVFSRKSKIPSFLLLFSSFLIFPTISYAIYIVIAYLIGLETLPGGLNQIVILLLILIGLTLFIFSLFIMILQEILDYQKNSPRFHVEDSISYSLRID